MKTARRNRVGTCASGFLSPNIIPTSLARFPILLNGLVETLLRGDSFPPSPAASAATAATAAADSSDGDEIMDGGHKNASKFDHGDASKFDHDDEEGGLNISNDVDRGGEKNGATASKDCLLDASCCHGTEVSWKDLEAPAARVWAACRPCDPNQLRIIDAIFGEIFRVRL